MKKYFLEAVIFILLILNVFVIYIHRNSAENMEKSTLLIKQLKNEISDKEKTIDKQDYLEEQEFINQNTEISIDTLLMVKQSIDQPLLIYRFSLSGCHTCVDSMLAIIKKAPNMIKKNILIISDDKITNELYVRLHYLGMSDIKYATFQKLPFPFESEKKPYFFIIDKNRIVRTFFIPDIVNKKRTLNYLNYIVKRYWIVPQ